MAIKRKSWLAPFVLGIIGILVWFFYWRLLLPPFLTFSDTAKFADMARQISKGQSFSTNFAFFGGDFFELGGKAPFRINWFPLFPLILALNFFLFGIGDKIVILTSGFFFILSSVLVFLVAEKLFGRMVGILSAMAFIFTSSMLEYASIGASESLFVFEIILTTYLLLFKNKWTSFLAGIVVALMFLTRQQAPIYLLGFLIFLFLTKKEASTIFLAGTALLLGPIFLIGKVSGINFFGQQPLSLLFEHSSLTAPNVTLRGGIAQFSLQDIITNIKPLVVKTFYNFYNFYKGLASLLSPYLLTLFILSLFKKEKNSTIFAFKMATLVILVLSFLGASLTIPFMRYIHPAIPLLIIFSVSFLVWLVEKLWIPVSTYRYVDTKVVVFFLIFFFVIGQTLGQIFLDSRYLGKLTNKNKPPINFLLGKMVGNETKPDDLVVTNLDTWGSWYGERRTIWLPFKPGQLVPPQGQKTKIDVIFLTSYLADDPAQALGSEWRRVLDDPENLTDPFIKENFPSVKKFRITPEENYNKETVYGVILRRK